MPITVNHAHWANITRPTTVTFEGETANVIYYPNRITPDMITQITANKDDINALGGIIEQVVATWDVVGTPAPREPSDAEPIPAPIVPRSVPQVVGMYPLERWALAQLPIALLNAVIEAVFAGAIPNSKANGAK